MSVAWYRKWRPQQFTDVIGQDHVTAVLQQALLKGQVSHAYLFCGPRGVGKTTMARLLGKTVNCTNPKRTTTTLNPCGKCACCTAFQNDAMIDCIEIDAASNRGIDDIRQLRDTIHFAPVLGTKKVYIIDEVHMLTKEAFNALLKTLEEPPEHVILILATTEGTKVPATIMSRCQRFDFYALTVPILQQHLELVAKQEGLQLTKEGALVLAEAATGSGRDALSLLQQVSLNATELTEVEVTKTLGFVPTSQVTPLLKEASHNGRQALLQMHQMLESGASPEQVIRTVLRFLASELHSREHSWTTALSDAQLLQAAEEWAWALQQLKGHPESYLVLGTALLSTAKAWGSSGQVQGVDQLPAVSEEPHQAPVVEQKPDTSKDDVSTTIEIKHWQPGMDEAQVWQQLISAARPHNQSLAALLRDAQMLGIEGGIL